MNEKTRAFEAAAAKLYKPEISTGLAQQLAHDYRGFRETNPNATLDEYLQTMGITMYRERYVTAVGHYVSHGDSTREGMVMDACNLGPEPARAAAH